MTGLFSLLTILFTYFLGCEVTGNRHTGLLAGALAALLPQFTFRGISISNDALVATTSAATTYLIVRLLRRGFTWRDGFLASLSVALTFLSKISGVIFVPVLLFALLPRKFSWQAVAKRLAVLLPGAFAVGPWLFRNQKLYGDPLAAGAMSRVVPSLVDIKSISSPYFLGPFLRSLSESFVGVFGWMNVSLPGWAYTVFFILGFIGAAGLLFAIRQGTTERRLILALCSIPLLAFASVVQLNLMFTQPQGRYLFPALASVMVLMAVGLESFPKWNLPLMYGLIALLAFINVYALMGVELKAYWLQNAPASGTVEDISVSVDRSLGRPAGPLPPGGEFGQTFVADGPNLTSVQITIATDSKRIPAGVLRLRLRARPDDTQDIASIAIPAVQIADNGPVSLTFPPIIASQGRSYYVSLDAKGISAGYPLTVYVTDRNSYPPGEFYINHVPTGHNMCFRTLNMIGGPLCLQCR